MFDPSTGEDLEVKRDLSDLHDDDFVNDTDVMLSDDVFRDTIKSLNITSISYNECIGYKLPLFLGGADTISNYEKVDIEVYWSIQCQLFKKVMDIDNGTNIKSFGVE